MACYNKKGMTGNLVFIAWYVDCDAERSGKRYAVCCNDLKQNEKHLKK